MTDLSEQARKRLEQQRIKYLEGLRDKTLALNILDQDWRDGQLDVLMDIRHVAHKLAGSAGLYGFDALSRVARKLDEELRLTSPSEKTVRVALDSVLEELQRLQSDNSA